MKTPAQIDMMRETGRVVARALEAMQQAAKIGVTLKEIDAVGAQVLADAGATSPFLNYHPDWSPVPFPGSTCTSVNDGAATPRAASSSAPRVRATRSSST